MPQEGIGGNGEEVSDSSPLLPTASSQISGRSTFVNTGNPQESVHPSQRRPKRLILCFDGTAENFEGNSADSNVVKLYSKFDRTDPDQLHYYQRNFVSTINIQN